MPMPAPMGDESRSDFMARCMGNDTMMSDFPEQDQRAAVCMRQWNGEKSVSAEVRYANYKLEIKSLNEMEFEGYASTFGNVDLVNDIVMSGAFKDTLAEYRKVDRWPRMYLYHKPDQIPGKWLWMQEDSRGLAVKGRLLPTTLGKDTHILMINSEIDAMSIGYKTMSYDYDQQGNRLLKQVHLPEVSLATQAVVANPLARIEAAKIRELEHELRDELGLSQLKAKKAISLFRSHLNFDAGIRDVDPTRDVEVDEAAALDVAKRLYQSMGLEALRR